MNNTMKHNFTFIIKGDFCYSASKKELAARENHFLICINGICAGIFENIPMQYRHIPVTDYSGHLILPGLTDLHTHAPQYSFRGMGMDLELLDWLNTHTFPEESRYEDLAYARNAYRRFTDDMIHGPSTRACIFATRHVTATLLLMDMLDASGLITKVGKVNMDRNCPFPLCEADFNTSLSDTQLWLEASKKQKRCLPILTPRFIPSCSDPLMKGLADLQKNTGLPVQSHLSENLSEIEWVQELCPDSRFYGDAYYNYHLFGGETCPTIMAHCVHSSPEEIELLKSQNVWVAHCPQSNANLSSGIAPVRRYLDQDLRIGLGSDIAGGTCGSIFRAMADAIQVSKLYWRLIDTDAVPVTVEEAFWMGTAGGGTFFGKTGSFLPGWDADILVMDESRFPNTSPLTLRQRLERVIYLSEDRDILHKFVAGRQLF